MLELLSAKASVDQLARRFGVRAATVEGWRDQALEGIGESLRQGTGKSARELELERDLSSLEKPFTHLAIKHELVERALKDPCWLHLLSNLGSSTVPPYAALR
jgi:transposase-like protein